MTTSTTATDQASSSREGKLYIDSLDAMTEYGVFVERNGYRQIVQMPVFKKLDATEWPEEDGVEVDVSTPMLDARKMQVQLCMTDYDLARDLFVRLSDGSYHTWNFAEIGVSKSLRMESNGSFQSLVRLGRMTLTLCDDNPSVDSATPYAEGGTEVATQGYSIDGYDMSRFGAHVLKGSRDSYLKAAEARKNMSVSAKNNQGVEYDGYELHWKSKDVTISLLIQAGSVAEFHRRYDALFTVLTASGLRTLAAEGDDYAYHAYYKSSSVSRFDVLPGGKVWCQFGVTLTVTDWRPLSAWTNLETEENFLVLTEDEGYNILIR